ncbi:MAG TPA: hypothetical protein VGX48_27900 [Pyrinomonadaceae bacterium]|jgi:hypothetical protein|nr:hypothetical protein [Pyrinomonadaceae bacterium]
MPGSRRPGLYGTDPLAPSPRTPGLLGVNDAGEPALRLADFLGDTPGLLGVNDWADPSVSYAAAPAAFVSQERPFSFVAANKMWDLFKDHPNQVGSHRRKWLQSRGLPDDTVGRQRTDCITYVKAVLVAAYEQLGQKIFADGVRQALGTNALGADLANYLVRKAGWKAHYWNPDVNHPRDFDYPRTNYSYWNTLKHGVYYAGEYPTKVPVSGYIVNYRPVDDYMNPRYEDKRLKIKHNHPTTPERDAFERFLRVTFAFGLGRGGDHTFMYSEGHVFEVHWNAVGDDNYRQHWDADGDDLYERSPFEDFPLWYSGLMVVPPDSPFESDRKTPPAPGAPRRAR